MSWFISWALPLTAVILIVLSLWNFRGLQRWYDRQVDIAPWVDPDAEKRKYEDGDWSNW